MARCLAVAMSQAPGLSGTPDSGHTSRAMTSASCASSSAMPTSRTMRATPAMILAYSILTIASTASVSPDALTSSHQTSPLAAEQPARSGLGDLAQLGGDAPVLFVALQEPFGPLERLGLVLGLEDGVTTHDLLGLGEGSV